MDETHRDRAGELAKWLNAYADGAEIEYTYINKWYKVNKNHTWDVCAQYRIAVTKDSINWDHVAPEFKWMARDEDGSVFIYKSEPHRNNSMWMTSPCVGHGASLLSSYKRGTVEWSDSLVERPAGPNDPI